MKYYKLFVILFIFYFISCDKKNSEKPYQKAIKTQKNHSTESIIKKTPDKSTKINYTDKKGLKQGVWKTYSGNQLVKLETFKNGKLNGISEEWLHGEHTVCNFVNDKLDGFFYSYRTDSIICDHLVYFKNGEKLWHGFPTALYKTLNDLKPFVFSQDETTVEILFANGKLMYEGKFILTQKVLNKYKGEGIHNMYYPSGNLKAKYNYETDTMIVFFENGEIFKVKRYFMLSYDEQMELMNGK